MLYRDYGDRICKVFKGSRPAAVLYLCAVSVLTYIAHNLVSFQQVLNTPFIFIILGIGEKYYAGTRQRITAEGT